MKSFMRKKRQTGRKNTLRENVPFKKRLAQYIEQRERMIAKAPIDLRLNTEVTPEYARSVGADVIVAALGARPIIPDIPGIDGKNVIGAEAAYTNPGKVGKTAVILGGGMVGMELAIYLDSLGNKVCVVEMAEKFNPGLNELHGFSILIKMEEEGIPAYFTKAVR